MEKSDKKNETNRNTNEDSIPDTKTTGSGYTERDHNALDGNNSETPFDPKDPDFPGNDSRH